MPREERLNILRPAAELMKERFGQKVRKIFKQRTGSLAESFQVIEPKEDNEFDETFLRVAPRGKHKSGVRKRKSRAGSPDRKYAKHNREVKAASISNSELAYLLEYGTPRMRPTHFMEIASEEAAEDIAAAIEKEWDAMLERKGF